MAITQLQLGAWAGRRYGAFSGKNTTPLVYGPARVTAAAVYVPGGKACAVYQPGGMAGAVYVPGGKAGAAQ